MRFSPRAKLAALGMLFALPVVASYLTYYVWKPSASRSYGELLPTTPLPPATLSAAPDIQGKWVLLVVDSGRCDEACTRKLYLMRQVRLAQGKHMERIARAWVIDDGTPPAPQLRGDFAGTVLLDDAARWLPHLPAADGARRHIYLIDPLGNLVLRYPGDPDPKGLIKDLQRLLSVSQIG